MASNVKNRFGASLKDAVVAALLALALSGPLLASDRHDNRRSAARSALGAVGIAVGIVFVGRLLLNLFVFKTDRP